MKPLRIFVVSDSTGETGEVVARALISQFNELQAEIVRWSHIITKEAVDSLFENNMENVIIINSIVVPDVTFHLKKRCLENHVREIDLLNHSLQIIEEQMGVHARRLAGLTRELDMAYFDKIASIEFAVKYDDGKDARGLKKADIVLVGISRTSKTPLSLFLANKGYNVANLPLLPELPLPAEIFKVDPKRIAGLIISPEKLNKIRQKRLEQFGISSAASYAEASRIEEELQYAKDVFAKLGCRVIDVSDSTIEKTATDIVQYLKMQFGDQVRRHEQA